MKVLCTDIVADTVEEAQEALQLLQEKCDAVCKLFFLFLSYIHVYNFLFSLIKTCVHYTLIEVAILAMYMHWVSIM